MPSCPMPHHAPFTEKTKSFLQGRQLLTHRPATIGANTCQVDCLKMKTVTPSQIHRLIFAVLEDFPRLHRDSAKVGLAKGVGFPLNLQRQLPGWCNLSTGLTNQGHLSKHVYHRVSGVDKKCLKSCTNGSSVHDICDLLPLLDLTSNHYI